MNKKLQAFYLKKANQEAIEHRDVLLAIASLIRTKEGQDLFKYIFKNFEVANLPDKGLEGNILHEYLGFLRAGNSIYKIACEAASETAASILAKIERERYDDLIQQQRAENEPDDTTDGDSED